MTRLLPRTNFHSSELLRCLADLALVDAADPGNAFAEKLGVWIHFTDAIALSAVHSDSMSGTAKIRPDMRPDIRRAEQTDACAAIAAEFDRIRAFLVNSITRSCSSSSPNAGKTHIKLPAPVLELPMDLAAAFMLYRRFYEAHQRDMELSIQPLRTNVRAAVAQASPRLKKLAELDATLEKILRERESKLLGKVPVLLKRRFEHLYKAHQHRLDVTKQTDNPAAWTKGEGWLALFCHDMQMLLLAEVELRLQPTMGLIEAFKQDTQ